MLVMRCLIPKSIIRNPSFVESTISLLDDDPADKLAYIERVKARFYPRLQTNAATGCHEWTGPLDKEGRGHISIHDFPLRTHRVGYILAHGCIAEAMHVLHHCDNPKCANPKHLFLGTHDDNMADRESKGRAARGEASGGSRLSDEDVSFIRSSGIAPKKLAEQFGVGRSHIYHIQQNRRRKG